MQANGAYSRRRVVEYDGPRHRVWILGQRCHHGATGSLVATLVCLRLVVSGDLRSRLLALAATGGALMVHDWKDHAIWFERGRGAQP